MTRGIVTINPKSLTAVFSKLFSIEQKKIQETKNKKQNKKIIFQGTSTSDVCSKEKFMARSLFVATSNAVL
jgi:hypothetical protein